MCMYVCTYVRRYRVCKGVSPTSDMYVGMYVREYPYQLVICMYVLQNKGSIFVKFE